MPDDIDPKQLNAAIKKAMAEATGNVAQPVVGRTPSDAVAEVVNSVLILLGRWTVPILFVGALAVAWYYQQEQTQRKDEAYNEALATLRDERDSAYLRISEFNKEVATISSQQISNLSQAFESLKKINEDAAEQQQAVFDLERTAAEYADALEQSQEDATDALEASRAELQIARNEVAEGQRLLKENQALLSAAQEKTKERAKEVERREVDLTVRGGRIGELQDQLRTLQETSGNYIQAFNELLNALDWPDTDENTLLTLREDLFNQGYQYDLALGVVRDMTVDVAKVLMPLGAFGSWGLSRDYADELVGLSKARFVELLQANDGYGFAFWTEAEGRDRTPLLIGLAINTPRQMRLVFLELSGGNDTESRIVSTESADLLLPVVGPNVTNAWKSSLFFTVVSPDGAEVSGEDWSDVVDKTSVALQRVFRDDITFTNTLVGDDAPQLPLLTRESFLELFNSNALPLSAQRDLSTPGENNLRTIFDMIEERNGGAQTWRASLRIIEDPILRVDIVKIMEAAVEGALDPLEARVPADLAGGGDVLRQRSNNATIRATIRPEDLGKLAALALHPSFGLEVTVAEKCEQDPIPQKGQESEPTCFPEARVVAYSNEGFLDFAFEDRAREGRWMLARFGADANRVELRSD